MTRLALAALVLTLAVSGCQKAPSPLAAAARVAKPAALAHKVEIQQVTVQQAAALMASDHAPLFIDVRDPDEYAGGHARGAVSHPLPDLDAWAKALDKDAPTMVICHSGRRSMLAAQGLLDRGFTHVVNVQGGTAAWIAANLPIDVPSRR